VLLTSLEGKHKGPSAASIGGFTDNATRKFSHQSGFAGHKAKVGAAVGQRHSQGLAFAYRYIRAKLAGAFEHPK